MSHKRQGAIFDSVGNPSFQITTLEHDYPAGCVIPLHFHDRDQLVFATLGIMTIHTRDGAWVVPTHRAVWIPAWIPHTITMSGTVKMRTLYFKDRLAIHLPRSCCVVHVSPLLRELILHACTFRALKRRVASHRHLIDLILDQVRGIRTVPLQLPNPSDPRAFRVAKLLLQQPGDRRRLTVLCKTAGASKRTVERLFREQIGMTLGRWRQQLRLMEAMRLLAEGQKVTYAALEAGYATPSAFISMFRKTLGTTPAQYFRNFPEEAR